MTIREGSCRCENVTFSVRGEPTRIGICHCTDCRQESGSAFTYFGIWPIKDFLSDGEIREHDGRSFCPLCGSRLFATDGKEAEIKLGCLNDAPTDLVPTYELWVKRRETWLGEIAGADQFDEDRT